MSSVGSTPNLSNDCSASKRVTYDASSAMLYMSVANGIDAIPTAVSTCVRFAVFPVALASSIAAAISGFCVAAVNENGLVVSPPRES